MEENLFTQVKHNSKHDYIEQVYGNHNYIIYNPSSVIKLLDHVLSRYWSVLHVDPTPLDTILISFSIGPRY